MTRTLLCPYFLKAFSFSVPIGGLAGLVGLGGGEFRLPVLMRAIGFTARSAVPLNLTISLVTLAFALFARNQVLPVNVVTAHVPELLGLTLGGIASAFYGANLVRRLSDRQLVSLISGLLISLGLLLIIEAFAAHPLAMNLTPEAGVRFVVGVAIGVGVGTVSSVLGVAGGELLIPALIFVFGADIRVAGTASLLISLGS
jgi:uncharacterized protein